MYSRNGEVVTLDIVADDYAAIIFALGSVAGQVSREREPQRFWKWIAIVNRVNEGNPDFTPYEIPPEFRA